MSQNWKDVQKLSRSVLFYSYLLLSMPSIRGSGQNINLRKLINHIHTCTGTHPHEWYGDVCQVLKRNWKNWQKEATSSVVDKNKVIYQISAQNIKACRRKVRKTVYFQYSKFKKGHNSYKNWRKETTLKLDL